MTYPFVTAVAIGILSYIFSDCYPLDFIGLVDSSLNIFGILIGFLITVLTIINSIENSYTRALVKGGSYHLLSLYLKHAIWGCFISIVFGISYIFFFKTIPEGIQDLADAVFMFSFIFALFSSYRFIKIFLKLSLT